MRTTLAIEDDAMLALKAHAAKNGLSLGEAASELIRNGSRYQLSTHNKGGLPVFEVPADFPAITDEMVRGLLEEE
jgi:hypothetical protein